MAKLTYSYLASLDGYVADADGDFSWAAPDEEVHAFVNDLERSTGTHLLGRRTYELMSAWETDPGLAQTTPVMREFAELWQRAEKVVYSTSLQAAPTRRTRIERELDPEAVRRLKTGSRDDLAVGGPELAAHALRAGLVDECRVLVVPVVVGGGTPMFPPGLRLRLELLEERRFAAGTTYLRYRTVA